ncbi:MULTISPECIES: HEPN domain-containing protein [unclassified Candidatus Frackibacter]|nr:MULTISPECIES: HEPN domain-containing protein [unclassified Candidatus Frackibacter]
MEIEDECLRLTDYGVNVRYPFSLELTLDDMELAIKDAISIQKFVLDKVE